MTDKWPLWVDVYTTLDGEEYPLMETLARTKETCERWVNRGVDPNNKKEADVRPCRIEVKPQE